MADSSALESRLQWSRTRYSLRDFIVSTTRRTDTPMLVLPAVVRVAEGYVGGEDDDQSHNVNEGAVYFVYFVDQQPRVIVQTEDGRYISFARSCPLLFHVILNDQSLGGASVLDEIVERERNNVGDLRIRMAEAEEGGGLGPKDAGYEDVRGVLTVLDLFDEKYLLCHPLRGDRFRCAEVVSIPSYLPLSVCVARGWKAAAAKSDFREFLIDVSASGHVAQRRYSEQPTRNSEEIVVFSDLPNGDYELIVPSSASSSSSSVEMSRIPSFKVFDKKKPTKSSPDDSSGSEVAAASVSPPPASRPSLPPRKLSGGWTSAENLMMMTSSSHLARRPLPPVPDENPETGSGPKAAEELPPRKIQEEEEEEEEEGKKKMTKTLEDRKEKKSAAKSKNKSKRNFFAFMKDTGRYSPHSKSSDEAPEVRENPDPEERETEEEAVRKGPRSYVRRRTKGVVERKRIPEKRAELIRFAREFTAEEDGGGGEEATSGSLNCGPEAVAWTGSDRSGVGSSSLTSSQERRDYPRPLVTFSRNITANPASATKATEGGGRVKPPVAKKPTSSSSSLSSFLPSATTTTTTTTTIAPKTGSMTLDQSSRTSSSPSLAKKKTSKGQLPELDPGDSGMFSSSSEPPPPPSMIQSSCGGGGGGGGGEADEYESYYDVIQSPRGKTSVSSEEEEEASSSGGGVYPETPDRDDFRWDPMMSHPQTKSSQQQQQQHRRMEDSSGSDQKTKALDSFDEEGDLDSSYEEIRLLPHSSRPPSSTITPPSTSTFDPGNSRQSWRSPDSTACDLTISLHEEEDQTAPRPPSLSSSAHLQQQQQNHLWASVDEVPDDVSSLSVEQVSACLNVLNLGHYVRSFREQQIDGALLTCLDREVLVGDFRFRSFEAIKLVKFARDGWRPRIRNQNETNA